MTPHEDLIGYLLGALDPSEHARVEAELRSDPRLRDELRRVKVALLPLESERDAFDPPPGLAERTVQYVEQHRAIPRDRLARANRISGRDVFATVTAVAAIALLVFPALLHARFDARVVACQQHLQSIGTQLVSYANLQPDGSYPPLSDQGNMAFVGGTAVELFDQHYLPADARVMICPGDGVRTRSWGGVPSTHELMVATGRQLRNLQEQAGGSYGWPVGVIVNGRFRAPQHKGRAYFVILSDSPSPSAPHLASQNHDGIGWNVLYDDLHVEFVSANAVVQTPDDPLRNHLGLVAAGIGDNDSVVAPSGTPIRVITSILLDNEPPPVRPGERVPLRH